VFKSPVQSGFLPFLGATGPRPIFWLLEFTATATATDQDWQPQLPFPVAAGYNQLPVQSVALHATDLDGYMARNSLPCKCLFSSCLACILIISPVRWIAWLRSYCPFLISCALQLPGHTLSCCLLDLLSSSLLACIHQYHKPQKGPL
jgi:hypothetical protein